MICLKVLQFSCLLLLICVSLSEQYTALIPQKEHSGKTPYCIDEVEGKKLLKEEWYDLKNCESRTCIQNSNGVYISIAGCGSIVASPNCKLVKPTGAKAYPACCPQLKCEE